MEPSGVSPSHRMSLAFLATNATEERMLRKLVLFDNRDGCPDEDLTGKVRRYAISLPFKERSPTPDMMRVAVSIRTGNILPSDILPPKTI